MTLTENFIADAVHLDAGAEVMYGADEMFDSYPIRFATVEFQLIAKSVRCNFCGCAFVPEAKTLREGEIEYTYFNCDYCGKAYIVSVTDAALRRSIRKYRSLAEKLKVKPLSEDTLREVTALKDANTKRAAELRQMYIREE